MLSFCRHSGSMRFTSWKTFHLLLHFCHTVNPHFVHKQECVWCVYSFSGYSRKPYFVQRLWLDFVHFSGHKLRNLDRQLISLSYHTVKWLNMFKKKNKSHVNLNCCLSKMFAEHGNNTITQQNYKWKKPQDWNIQDQSELWTPSNSI